MTPKQRIMSINLLEKISKNPDYSEKLGIEVEYKSFSIQSPEAVSKENFGKRSISFDSDC